MPRIFDNIDQHLRPALAETMEIARAADSQIIHKPMDLSRVVETNGPGWTGSLTPARHAWPPRFHVRVGMPDKRHSLLDRIGPDEAVAL